MPSERVIVFCKAPRPGFVKTRLAGSLGPEAACATYRALTEKVLSQISGVEWVQLRHTPDEAREEIAPWKRHPCWTLEPQGPGDLGERMARAFQSEFDVGTDRVVLIGTDTPELLETDLHEALDALRRHDVVLGPSLDGGYWLIGLSEPHPRLLEGIDWSTPAVLQQTLQKATVEGLQVHLLRVLADIDTGEDLSAYQQRVGMR